MYFGKDRFDFPGFNNRFQQFRKRDIPYRFSDVTGTEWYINDLALMRSKGKKAKAVNAAAKNKEISNPILSVMENNLSRKAFRRSWARHQ